MFNRFSYTVLFTIICTVSFGQKNEFDGVNFDTEVHSMNRFGFELFQEVTQTDRNVIYSPFSLSVILSMLENGSGGLTSGEITGAIHLNDDRDERNEQYLAMFKYLAEDTLKNGAFEWANIVYLAREVESKEDYRGVLDEYYYSELENLDFSTESVVTDKMQKWMGNTLNHEVAFEMEVAHVSRDVELLLANTIHLNGDWKYAFEETPVIDTFTTSNFHEIVTPYAKGVNYPIHLKLNPNHPNDSLFVFDFKGSLQLEVLFPSANDTLANILERINTGYYNDFEGQGQLIVDTIYLPLLNLSEMNNMKAPLSEMGMSSAFSSQADFSEIADGIMLEDVVHHGELVFGTRGAKETDKGYSQVKVSTKQPYKVVKFNRPFVFFVKGKRSDVFVFMGVVNRF